MIPESLRPLFWDVNPDQFNPYAWPDYTIGRVLELGDDAAIAWMKNSFTEDEIKRVIRSERRLTRRSANYWALVYRIPFEEIAALR